MLSRFTTNGFITLKNMIGRVCRRLIIKYCPVSVFLKVILPKATTSTAKTVGLYQPFASRAQNRAKWIILAKLEQNSLLTIRDTTT